MKLETIREAYMRADSIWRDARRAKNDQLIREARDLHDTTAAAVNACGPVFAEVAVVYCESMKRGNVVPDIDHWLYNATPADVVSIFRENGIKRFTMSSTWTDALETAAAFIDAGCRLEGMQTVFVNKLDIRNDKYKTGPALVFYID